MIGGGAAAVALLDSLLTRADRFRSGPRIVIYEPSMPAHGMAFGPDLDSALINLPVGRMSIRHDDPSDFARWLGEGGPDSYVPRQVYGEYLADVLRVSLHYATTLGWQVEVVRETATAVDADGDDLLVRSPASVRSFSHVVLGLGPGTTADPFGLLGSPGFVPDPYPLAERLPDVPANAHVLVIGAGLTAVDVTLGLLRLGHQGQITMASRSGILPGVRPRLLDLRPQYATIERLRTRTGGLTLREIWSLIKAELRGAGYDPDTELSWFRPGISAAGRLRHQLANLDDRPVESLFDNAPVAVPPMIRAVLSPAELHDVAFTYRPYLKSIQCPMPPSTGMRLLSAMDAGQLNVVPGLGAVDHRSGRFTAAAAAAVPAAEVVIDATRVSPRRTAGRARELIQALSAGGLVTWDPYDGLVVDSRSRRAIPAPGVRPRRLYAIGEITVGEFYYASSLPAVRRGADAVAEEFARHAEERLAS